MARVVETDNFGGDYPDEKFVSESLPLGEAKAVAADLNRCLADFDPRYNIVVNDDYVLRYTVEGR